MGLFIVQCTWDQKVHRAKDWCTEQQTDMSLYSIFFSFVRALYFISNRRILVLQNEQKKKKFKCGLVNKFKMNTYKVTVTMFILLGNIYNNKNLTESRVYILNAHSRMNEA